MVAHKRVVSYGRRVANACHFIRFLSHLDRIIYIECCNFATCIIVIICAFYKHDTGVANDGDKQHGLMIEIGLDNKQGHSTKEPH